MDESSVFACSVVALSLFCVFLLILAVMGVVWLIFQFMAVPI
jgi:hypothetical protein